MAKTFTLETPMAPLWLAFSDYHRYSLGWRMGSGESYKYDFWDWYHSLSITEQGEYSLLFPEPKMWRGTYTDEKHSPSDPYGLDFWSPDGQPTYGLPHLLQESRQKKELDYLFFWGHKPAVDGRMTKSCFSQWWQSAFSLDIHGYCCMEQYMMAEKARLFEDSDTEEKIMLNQDPAKIKTLGRQVKNFDEMLWNKYKYTIVLEGNFHKFSQNRSLFYFLLNTKDKILVEASPVDKIWGIGLNQTSPEITDPLKWQGENLLGFALMEVRAEIKRVYRHYDRINWHELLNSYPSIKKI